MQPESWTALEVPMVLLLADVCNTLGLTEEERAIVLGQEGAQALAENLETRIHPVPSPRPPMRERQAKALAYAREHGMIDLGAYRTLCPYWSDETLRLDLVNLVKRGLLSRNGINRGTHYTLAE
jgi:predicted HTH transcriptional regulator